MKCVNHANPTPVLLFGNNAWNQREAKYADIKDELSFEERVAREGGRQFLENDVVDIPSHLPLTRVPDWTGVIAWAEGAVKDGKI